MTFELTILGSASALPTSTKFPTAQVLHVHERFFLIDCGEGTQIQLRKAKVPFGKINHIFISHTHGDHIFGLFGLLSSFNLLGRKTPLYIYGHPDIEKIINMYLENFSMTTNYEIHIYKINKRQYQSIYEDKVVEVMAFPLKHRIPCFGYLFREKKRPLNIRKDSISGFNLTVKQIKAIKNGEDLLTPSGKMIPNRKLTKMPYKLRSYAYCTDTLMYKKIVPYIKGVDLLYHEATFADADKKLARLTGHATTKEAAIIASEASVKQLLIGHFSNRYKLVDDLLGEAKEIFRETYIAEDLKSYAIPLMRESKV